MIRLIVPLLLIFVLGACTPVQKQNKNFEFGAKDITGLAVLKNPQITNESTIYFQSVDLDQKIFVGETLEFRVCGVCFPASNTYNFEKGENPDYKFLPFPPGIYAMVGLYSFEFGPFTPAKNIHRCYSKGTVVFEVKAGEIIVLSSPVKNDTENKSVERIKSIISHYPKITADVVKSKPLAIISFHSKAGRGLRVACLKDITGRPFNILKKYQKETIAQLRLRK